MSAAFSKPRSAARPLSVISHRVRALECRIENGGVAIPVDAVGQIVEYDVAPLPLARGAVRGLGLVDGKIVVSLGMGRVGSGRRRAKGVLLRTANDTGHWAFEVTEVLSFIEVDEPAAGTSERGRHGMTVATADARELAWIDADRIVADADLPFAMGGSR